MNGAEIAAAKARNGKLRKVLRRILSNERELTMAEIIAKLERLSHAQLLPPGEGHRRNMLLWRLLLDIGASSRDSTKEVVTRRTVTRYALRGEAPEAP